MRFLILTTVAYASLIPEFTSAEVAEAQPLQWNVFLANWQLLGPFPKKDASGLETEYVDQESTLSFGQVRFYENSLYTWKPYDQRVIDFRLGLNVPGSKGEDKVGYALTQFVSPVAQKAQMSVSYDDAFIAWLNEHEVARGADNWASSLDQEVVDVDLKEGVNTLLLRVANGRTRWDAAVRFLPAGLEQPLLTFKAVPAANNARLPVVDVEFLDADRKLLTMHQCSGSRKAYPGISGYYALYAPIPDPVPDYVRISVRQRHFQQTQTIGSWERVQRGNMVARLLSDPPASLLVIDKLTRQPVPEAQIWSGQTMAEAATGPDGKVTLPDVTPMSDRLYVVGPGYEATSVSLKWPRGAMQRVELVKGGRTLTGSVVSTTGKPIAGATVNSGLSTSGYSPRVTTSDDGRFVMYGLPVSRTTIYPTIEAPGHVARGRFSFALKDTTTSVTWELTPGYTITGQVVHHETGQPLQDIRITVGTDRFGGGDDTAPKTTTDVDGRYRLEGVREGQNFLHAFSDRHAPAMKTISVNPGVETLADFSLSEGKPVTGTITDMEGRPLSGVWLVTDTWNGARMFRREDRTDANGRFTLAHMPDTVTEVDILKSGFISHRNYQVKGGDTFHLKMKPVITHTITVRDTEGKLIPQLQIAKGYLWQGNSSWNWRTDEYETRRHYDRLKGLMTITIDEPVSYQVAYRFRAVGFQEEIVNIPRDASDGKHFTALLKPARVFSGQVVSASTGKPLPDIAVAIVSAEDQMRSDYYVNYTTPWQLIDMDRFTGQHTVTDSTGRFTLSPPVNNTDPAIALVSKEGGFHLVEHLEAVLKSPTLTDQVLELPFPEQGTIEGRLTVAGKPVSDSTIHLTWTGYGNSSTQTNQSFGFGGQVTTDASGVFRYPNIGPGNYQISRVFHFSLGQSSSMSTYLDSRNLTLLPGQTLTHDFSTPAGLTLSGTARDTDGNPVGNAVIKVATNDDPSRQLAATTTTVNGQFRIEHLPPNSYTVNGEHYAQSEQGYYRQDAQGVTTVELTEDTGGIVIQLKSINQQPTYRQKEAAIAETLAPDFTVTPGVAETPFRLSDHYGKVVVVCFWASWSNDAATIASLYEEYRDNPEVEFLTVFLQDEKQLQAFKEQSDFEITFPVIETPTSAPGPLYSLFGVTGQTGCFVIGRDGRFAAERAASSQLPELIKQALTDQQDDDSVSSRTARLDVTLSADGSDRGIQGARLSLKAFDPAGRLILEDRYGLPGTPRRILWRYPPVEKGGRVEVMLTARGIPSRTENLMNPTREQSLAIDVESPRVISGQIITTADSKPVAGIPVRLQMFGGELRTVTSDDSGHFSARCFPGICYATVAGSEAFAAAAISPRGINVPEDSDPEPLELRVVPAITLTGTVVDQAGNPVADATVSSQGGLPVTTGEDGSFRLTGVAATGTTRIWAMSGNVYGVIRLKNPDPDTTHTITLGRGLTDNEPAELLAPGDDAPATEVLAMTGEEVTWQPVSETRRLLVFCALWHPTASGFLDRALKWAIENETPIELISLDWSLDQARRNSRSVESIDTMFYAGPGTLNLDPKWPLTNGQGAFLISPEGKLISRLPE